MRQLLCRLALCGLVLASGRTAFASNVFTPITVPGSNRGTFVTGVAGTYISGYVVVDSNTTVALLGQIGSAYAGGGTAGTKTYVNGIDRPTGVNGVIYDYVGDFVMPYGIYEGFLETNLALYPVASNGYNGTIVNGVSNGMLVGASVDATGNTHAVEGLATYYSPYVVTNLTPIPELPGTTRSIAYGISGNTVVGSFTDASGVHGFIDSNGALTALDAAPGVDTQLYGVSGDRVVGTYWTPNSSVVHGFVYDISTQQFTPINDPDADSSGLGTTPRGIDGTTIVGYWTDSFGAGHSFATSVPTPEPAAAALLALVAFPLLRRRRSTV